MGFGGAASGMIASLKYNRRPKRRRYKNLNSLYDEFKDAKHDAIKDKTITEEELYAVKSKIRNQRFKTIKKSRIKSILILTIVMITTLILIFHFVTNWKNYISTENQIIKER